MQVIRGKLLGLLSEASLGLSRKEVIEQSSSFVFSGPDLLTFNDTIMVRTKNLLGFDAAVVATDFMEMISKLPDEELDITMEEGEIRIKGRRREAGLSCMVGGRLPIEHVTRPSVWVPLPTGIAAHLQQVGTVCGNDETMLIMTCIHITPDLIEGCDGFRFCRVTIPTGFPEDVLVPAKAMGQLRELDLTHVSQTRGWVHFKTASEAEVSIRCYHKDYHPGVDSLLAMNNPEKITLPPTLTEILERSEITLTASYDSVVSVDISNNNMTLSSRKDRGWYKEKKRIEYSGRPLLFQVHPKFFAEILEKTLEVEVDERKMKICVGQTQFSVCLTKPQ